MAPMTMKHKPLLLALVVVAGAAAALGWRARDRIAFTFESAETGVVELGPAALPVPKSLPARLSFAADGDVTFTAGDLSYDAVALTLVLTPLDEKLEGEAARATLKRLEATLLADDPGIDLVVKERAGLPALVGTAAREDHRQTIAVVLAGALLARLEAGVRDDAPGKWRDAARDAAFGLTLAGAVERDGLWRAFRERAASSCGSGDVDACLWAARAEWQGGALGDARALLERGLKHAGPLEVAWESVRPLLERGPPPAAPTTLQASDPAVRRLERAVALHRMLGDVALATGDEQRAVDVWGRAWPYDASGEVARRLLDAAAPLVAEAEAGAWLERAEQMEQRFSHDVEVRLAAARFASSLGAYDRAKAMAQRLYDERRDDKAIRRRAVSVVVTAPGARDPLPCSPGTRARVVETTVGTTMEACADSAGKRRGPGRAWFTASGRLFEEVTYQDDVAGAPDRRYWENGTLQRESFVDDAGAVTVRLYDPFGRPLEQEQGAANEAAVEIER